VARHDGLRWVRALTLACVMLAAGVSGHAAGGGGAPPLALLGPLLLILTLAASPFLDAPASSTRVVALVLAAQAALHVVLQVVGSAPATGAPMTMPASPGHPMTPVMPAHPTHLGMLAAHVGAALVVALWLAAGERAAWTVLGVVGLALAETWSAVRDAVTPRPVVVLAGPRPTAYPWAERPLRFSVWHGAGGLSRRGPPSSCAAA
jgi:hypothetical protein